MIIQYYVLINKVTPCHLKLLNSSQFFSLLLFSFLSFFGNYVGSLVAPALVVASNISDFIIVVIFIISSNISDFIIVVIFIISNSGFFCCYNFRIKTENLSKQKDCKSCC